MANKYYKKENVSEKKEVKKAPLFRMVNYILMGVGVILLVIGFFCLAGGAVDNPNVFDGAIFSTRRIVVAPILMLLGLVVEIVAIMWHPRATKNTETNHTEEA